MFSTPFKFAFRELILNRRRQIPFWILAGFLPAFGLARYAVAHYPNLFLHVRHVHVHHFTYGFFVLAIMGFISLTTDRYRRVQAFFYGIGLALAFDEFGMWVHLADRYNIDASQNAMVAIVSLLVFVVYGIGLLRRALIRAKRFRRR